MSFQEIFKTSSRCLKDVLQKRLQDIFKTSSRRLQDVFKTFSRRLAKMSSRRFQNILWSYAAHVKVFSRCLQDVFTTFLRRTVKSVIYTEGIASVTLLRNHGKCTKFVRVTTVSQVLIFHFTTLVAAYRGAFRALPSKGAFFAKTLHDFKLLIFLLKSSIADVPLSWK